MNSSPLPGIFLQIVPKEISVIIDGENRVAILVVGFIPAAADVILPVMQAKGNGGEGILCRSSARRRIPRYLLVVAQLMHGH